MVFSCAGFKNCLSKFCARCKRFVVEEYIKELEDLEGRGAKRNELERAEKARNKDFEDIRSRSDLTVENLLTMSGGLQLPQPNEDEKGAFPGRWRRPAASA